MSRSADTTGYCKHKTKCILFSGLHADSGGGLRIDKKKMASKDMSVITFDMSGVIHAVMKERPVCIDTACGLTTVCSLKGNTTNNCNKCCLLIGESVRC